MEQKKLYETPVLAVKGLNKQNIITMSPGSDNEANMPGWDPDPSQPTI